jgi:alkanesulfonate monooxygenase SsuD/methylene tetrahydromethanopterin reductase-like flavin-dependent oxidoreductase (luciferase family)
MAAARAAIERPMLGKYREYAAWKATSPDADRYAPSWEDALPRLVVGSPAQVVDQVARYAELGVDGLAFRFQFPGIDQAATLRCLERFGTEVMPHFDTARR